MDTAAFDYDLPDDAVAQRPIERRDAARLLVDRGPGRPVGHRTVEALPSLLEPGDLVVVNTTRVRRARLAAVRPSGGRSEVLLLEARPDGRWDALVRPSRRIPPGTALRVGDELVVEVLDDHGAGRRDVRLHDRTGPIDDRQRAEELIELVGDVPLPPYVRARPIEAARYQTVFADRVGSAAAPTAGLHLTTAVLDRCRAGGVEVASVDLAVGLDTFRPLTTTKVEDHPMHAERYDVPVATWQACAAATRVVAVGTTVVRALESAAATGARSGRTELLIHRPYDFAVVDVLLTNFHLPRSSLLALVDAFVGPRWRDLYDEALRSGYRFLSFGDAMLLERARGRA